MDYLIEALLVGIYCLIIKFFISFINFKNILIFFFIIGFIKHFFGNVLQLHHYYCQKFNHNFNSVINFNLFIESIGEGILFVIFGMILSKLTKNININIFFIGFILHIISELLGIHKNFCLQ